MKIPQSGLHIDNPAFPLLQAQISYWGITSAAGAAAGLTVLCADLANQPPFIGHSLKLLSGPAAGQEKTILVDAAGVVTVDDPFRDNTGAAITVAAGTLFVIGGRSGGGGGPIPPTGPAQGLSFMGDVTTFTNPTTFSSTDLAGFGDFAFLGTYLIYVFRDAAGVAPQGEFRIVTGYAPATGTFTHEAFSAPLAVGDKVLIIHISVLFPQIVARGSFTTSSATVPADVGRTEADNYWNGCTIMPLLGNDAFQPRQIADFANIGGVFILDPGNPFTAVPGNVWYIILKDSAALMSVSATINLMFALVNAIFTLKETGGTITTTGGVQDVYRNETPLGVFKPKKVLIDTTNNTAAETIVIKVYYRIISGGGPILKDTVSFAGVQAVPLKNIDLEPNRFGILVTLQRTAGGIMTYDYEVFYED